MYLHNYLTLKAVKCYFAFNNKKINEQVFGAIDIIKGCALRGLKMNLQTKFAAALLVVSAPFLVNAQDMAMTGNNSDYIPIETVTTPNDNDTTTKANFNETSKEVTVNPSAKGSDPSDNIPRGGAGNAQTLSMTDGYRNKAVVFLTVGSDSKYSYDEAMEHIKKYFDAYKVNTQFMYEEVELKGKGIGFSLFVNGHAFRGGDFINARELMNDHKNLMGEFAPVYLRANPHLTYNAPSPD